MLTEYQCKQMQEFSPSERTYVVAVNGQTFTIRELFLPPFPQECFDVSSRSFSPVTTGQQSVLKMTAGNGSEIRGVLLGVNEHQEQTDLTVAFSKTPNHPLLLGTLLQSGMKHEEIATTAKEGISILLPCNAQAHASLFITHGEGRDSQYLALAESVAEHTTVALLLENKIKTIAQAIFATSQQFMPNTWGKNEVETHFNFSFHPRKRRLAINIH